ncbi:TspO/MBR family protein [Halobacteriaceae archaeon SHR40]|uniref:TspO/MBR family protein n=1 Tax=Halovenus amylolytica TaxID=2500550 RepID=UPI000FE3EC98
MATQTRRFSTREITVAIAAVVGVNVIGAAPAALFGADTGWIDRPWFFPPDIAFPVVWTLLFTLMGISLFLVWREGVSRPAGTSTEEVRTAISIFAVQLALNVAWTPVFFGLQRPDLGLVVIGALWLAIVATIVAFNWISRRAAGLLVPYLAWVSFAFVLNYAIYAGVG